MLTTRLNTGAGADECVLCNELDVHSKGGLPSSDDDQPDRDGLYSSGSTYSLQLIAAQSWTFTCTAEHHKLCVHCCKRVRGGQHVEFRRLQKPSMHIGEVT